MWPSSWTCSRQQVVTLSPLLALAFLLGACRQAGFTPTPSLAPTRPLILYSSSTPSQTAAPQAGEQLRATPLASLPPVSEATATPFTHVIVKGDTMGGIALKYGVSLQDLLAANPQVDPHFLTIGKTIVVPIQINAPDPGVLPTLTPVPVQLAKPLCYVTSDGGAWCFLQIVNHQAQPLENLSAWIGLYTSSGELISSQTALAPLNLLPPEKSLPLAAYFPPPVPDSFSVRAELLTALPVAKGDPRYLQAAVQVEAATISQDGLQATLKGSVVQPGPPASLVWLAVVAYGQQGEVVGMRRWELSGQSFEATVFSLGPAIARLDALVEARP